MIERYNIIRIHASSHKYSSVILTIDMIRVFDALDRGMSFLGVYNFFSHSLSRPVLTQHLKKVESTQADERRNECRETIQGISAVTEQILTKNLQIKIHHTPPLDSPRESIILQQWKSNIR